MWAGLALAEPMPRVYCLEVLQPGEMTYTAAMIGATLGSYRITKRLSAGGMGEVYVAEHVLIGRKAAIKLLLPEVSQKPELVERFFNEAKATAAIGHPGIVEIFDFGFHDDGRAYLTMEYLEGEPLNRRIKRQGRVPLDQAIAILEHVCSALGAAHRKGIVHRDLKPDNIFLVRDPGVKYGERAKLLDFGIAKLTDENAGAIQTRTGMVMGTPAYMAPEQCRGAGEVDHRADMYALGCIFFALLCGRPPFVGLGAGEIIGLQQFMEPPRPSEIEPGVHPAAEALILRLLRKRPDERVQTTDDLATELARLSEQTGVGIGRAPTSQPFSPLDEVTEPPTGMPRRRAATPAPNPQQYGSVPIPQQQQFAPMAPVGPQRAATPGPNLLQTTPMPAYSRDLSSVPETLTPVPAEAVPGQSTTLGGAASQRFHVSGAAGKSRRWIPVTIAAAVVAVAGVLVLVMSGGSGDEQVAAAGPDAAGLDSAVAMNAGSDGGAGLAGVDTAGVDTAGTDTAGTDTAGGESGAGGAAGLRPDGEVEPEGPGEDGAGEVEIEAEPEMVELTIESTPAGAAVRLSGSRKVLGETPYVYEARRGDEELTFLLTLSGYDRERVSISASEDGREHVELKKRATSSGAKKPGKKSGKKPPDTKDPFGRSY